MAPMAVADMCDVSDANENNAEDNNQKITTTSLLDASKGGICASLYKEKSASKKLLMAMAYGIKMGHHNIGNWDVEPYASAKEENVFLPASLQLIDKVLRRCVSQKITPVKCNNYSKTRLLTWLSNNPIDDPVDVAFLVKEEAVFRKVLTDAKQEKTLFTNKEPSRNKPWLDNEPYLCLCQH
jgi:hypothetical protein